jgi:cyclophilin family peptidyl-prolyl cis-trans isomerase
VAHASGRFGGIWWLGLVCGCLVAVARGQGVPAVEQRPDAAKALAEFEAARQAERDLIGELTILQAQYQQPDADRGKVVARFEAAKEKIPAVRDRLETAAVALAQADPANKQARELCGAIVAAWLKSDDPAKALRIAAVLDQAGAAEAPVELMASSAAMTLSRLDEAAAFLKKAAAQGIPGSKVEELEGAIAAERPKVEAEMARRKSDEGANLPRVKLATTKGDVVVELFEDDAPNTVANFLSLVEKGLYNGTPFHRVIGGFMAQGGDPLGNGTGGPGHVIECEVDLPTARKHFYGTLSMAHAGRDTGGSQFFITFRPTEHLDGKHTVFGRVIEGFGVLPLLVRTQDEKGQPIAGQRLDKIVKAEVVRKRDHDYVPKTMPDPRR